MPDNFNHKLIQTQRLFLELSRLDLVKRLYELGADVSERSVIRWEDGEASPDADILPMLAEVLKVKVHEFYK